MIIALDYDDTFTNDPAAWSQAMQVLRAAGHTVYGVTMRSPHEGIADKTYFDACDHVVFTCRRGKKKTLNAQGVSIDVWIDDQPMWILGDARA